MNSKKLTERNCLDKTRNYISQAPKNTKYILELLSGDVKESERPDFLIHNMSGMVGVEHFLVDTLLGKKKAARSRQRNSEMNNTFNKYHGNIEGNEQVALKEIEEILQADVNSIQGFDYHKFIDEFQRIVEEHSKKAAQYRRYNDGLSEIIFMIEIPIPKNRMIGLTTDLRQKAIKGRRFPITADMLNILMDTSEHVDYVIISIMHEDYRNGPYAVYGFDNKRFKESITPQLDEVYLNFAFDWQMLPYKAKVKLDLETGEKQ